MNWKKHYDSPKIGDKVIVTSHCPRCFVTPSEQGRINCFERFRNEIGVFDEINKTYKDGRIYHITFPHGSCYFNPKIVKKV